MPLLTVRDRRDLIDLIAKLNNFSDDTGRSAFLYQHGLDRFHHGIVPSLAVETYTPHLLDNLQKAGEITIDGERRPAIIFFLEALAEHKQVQGNADQRELIARLLAPPEVSLLPVPLPRDDQPPPSTVLSARNWREALDRLDEADAAEDFEAALRWIEELRRLNAPAALDLDAPAALDLDAREDDIRRRQKASDQYVIVRSMVRRHQPAGKIRAALKTVWAIAPGYDPDGIAGQVQPVRLKEAQIWEAYSFQTLPKFNANWKAGTSTFRHLKLPDMQFCLVPTGISMMRDNDGLWGDSTSIHAVKSNEPYWIGRHPVTNAQWAAAVKAGVVKRPKGSAAIKWFHDPSMADVPVIGVSWFDAVSFCEWLGVRLPTEHEWEYAARGIEGFAYPWGNNFDGDRVWYVKNTDNKPKSVTTKEESEAWVKAFDLLGNVWEWTDNFREQYPNQPKPENNADSQNQQVLRGDSWASTEDELRGDSRLKRPPDYHNTQIGFRCAVSVQ